MAASSSSTPAHDYVTYYVDSSETHCVKLGVLQQVDSTHLITNARLYTRGCKFRTDYAFARQRDDAGLPLYTIFIVDKTNAGPLCIASPKLSHMVDFSSWAQARGLRAWAKESPKRAREAGPGVLP